MNLCVCPDTRMSTFSFLCSRLRAWRSPQGTTCGKPPPVVRASKVSCPFLHYQLHLSRLAVWRHTSLQWIQCYTTVDGCTMTVPNSLDDPSMVCQQYNQVKATAVLAVTSKSSHLVAMAEPYAKCPDGQDLRPATKLVPHWSIPQVQIVQMRFSMSVNTQVGAHLILRKFWI
jgi:hypothetical protein